MSSWSATVVIAIELAGHDQGRTADPPELPHPVVGERLAAEEVEGDLVAANGPREQLRVLGVVL